MLLFDQNNSKFSSSYRRFYISEQLYEQKIKMEIENWFSEYPSISKEKLKSDFQNNDNSFNGAFIELFFFAQLNKKFTNVEIEPRLLSSNNRPDFFVRNCMGEPLFYLEVGNSNEFSDEEKILNDLLYQFIDEINEIKIIDNYIVELETYDIEHQYDFLPNDIIMNKKYHDFEKFLSKVKKDFENQINSRKYFSIIKNMNNYELKLSFLEISNKDDYSRNINAFPTITGWESEIRNKKLRNPLKNKFDQHFKNNANYNIPFLIAINIYSGYGLNEEKIFTEIVFISCKFFENEYLSGIIVCNGITPFSLISNSKAIEKELILYHNPKAKNPFKRDYLKNIIHKYYNKQSEKWNNNN